ncbi:hypothetical protein KY290_027372 [Solanum tuberosum]|uniref:Uncharacterized protein n=1 Tax=Solanum tuberosum TaxID=4113 RepID=A0ABQ7UEU8_SOLTU|nr:hypothetical protein KY290_027372 [Solanum tuberosum]
MDMTMAYHPDLTGKLVDVTHTKALDTSHRHVLSAQERQARGRPVTDVEMETMAERYPFTESATFLCRTVPAFLEPLDDDKATVDEAIYDE